jgi:hypothetical protein
MKKHIIAAAVAAAVAVPAMAQVTISGNIEAGRASIKAGTTTAASYTQAGVESQITGTPEVRFSGAKDTALKRQLDQARDAVKRQRLVAQQARLDQARAAMVGS